MCILKYLFVRAASIQLREPHCSFLRVDKDDFNRILKSVEANTVRLREHGRDVLVLEKLNEKYDTTLERMVNIKYSILDTLWYLELLIKSLIIC